MALKDSCIKVLEKKAKPTEGSSCQLQNFTCKICVLKILLPVICFFFLFIFVFFSTYMERNLILYVNVCTCNLSQSVQEALFIIFMHPWRGVWKIFLTNLCGHSFILHNPKLYVSISCLSMCMTTKIYLTSDANIAVWFLVFWSLL